MHHWKIRFQGLTPPIEMFITPSSNKLWNNQRRGFTLVELLASIAGVALLSGLLISGAKKGFDRMDATVCASNLRQIYVAISNYAQDHEGYFPVVQKGFSSPTPGEKPTVWTTAIVPYYSDKDASFGGLTDAPPIQVCPTQAKRMREFGTRYAGFTYGMNMFLAPNDVFNVIHQKTINIPFPASTLLVTEGGYNAGSGIAGIDHYWLEQGATYKGRYLGGVHEGANNVLWCDGHVSSFKNVKNLIPPGPWYGGPNDKYFAPGFKPFP